MIIEWLQNLTWWQWGLIITVVFMVVSTSLVWAACVNSSRLSREEERKAIMDCMKERIKK